MKRKSVLFILLFMILSLCTACNGNVTRDIRHDGFIVSTKFICDDYYPKNNKDNSYKKVKYLTNSNIIDSDGHLYEVSLGQLYSNKQNCKKANTNITVKAIFDNSIVKGTDNKFYYLVDSLEGVKYSIVSETDKSLELYNLILKDDSVVKVITVDNSTGKYYVLKLDGNVYSYIINKENNDSLLRIVSRSVVYNWYDYKSKIVDFNYDGYSSSTYLKTEKSVYRMKITNDDCKKYADVLCDYRLLEDDVFEKYNDKIIAFNGKVVITDYKQVFTIDE